jgi:putative transposase
VAFELSLVLLYQQVLFSVKQMSRDFIHKARGVSNLKCHLVLTTKYRRKVLTDDMLTRLEVIFTALMEKWEGRLVEFNGERDHVHLLLQYTPQTEPSKLINNLKTVSSRYLRKEFVAEVNSGALRTVSPSMKAQQDKVYWKDVLWTSGYFIASCGGVTIDQLRKYIEEQDRPVE